MGKPTHSSISEDELEIILRVFDCSDTFGPVSNISRLDRYERSVKMGLEVNSLVSGVISFYLAVFFMKVKSS